MFKKVKPKNDLMYQDIYNCICQNTQKKLRYIIHYVKPTAQMDQHAGGKWLIHICKRGVPDLVKLQSREYYQSLLKYNNDLKKKWHDDVIKWKHFPRYWPFVRGIHRSTVNSPHKGQWHGALVFSFDLGLNERLSRQSWGWWFETQSCSLWRHSNGRP